MNGDDICRTCMKYEETLLNVFVPMKSSETTLLVADALNICASIKVTKCDGLPQNLCETCLKALEAAYMFRNQCVEVQNKLKALLNSSNTRKENTINTVKNEFNPIHPKDEVSDSELDNECEIDVEFTAKEEKKEEPNTYVCLNCQKNFDNELIFLEHMSTHACAERLHEEGPIKESEKCFDLKNNVIIQEPQKPYTCSVCQKKFKREALLVRHMVIHSEDIKHEPDENHLTEFKCSDCGKGFTRQRSLSCHMRKHNGTSGSSYKCNVCNKEFTQKRLLKRHLKLHDAERPFKCTKCPKSYSRQDQLVDHVNKHNGIKPNACPFCSKSFSQLCNLKDHVRTHTGEKPYLCTECGKGFNNSSNLRQHMLRHTGLKPFPCKLCPKKFCTKGQWSVHMGTHTGAHPFVCDTCGASFTKPNSLKKHQLIHLGIKPFECDACRMRFSCRDHLKRHYRIHTGEKPYKCKLCDRAFTQSNDLVKHTRSHLGQNIYQCTVCETRFRLLSELKQHYPIHYINGDDSIPLVHIGKKHGFAQVIILKPDEAEKEPIEISTKKSVKVVKKPNQSQTDES